MVIPASATTHCSGRIMNPGYWHRVAYADFLATRTMADWKPAFALTAGAKLFACDARGPVLVVLVIVAATSAPLPKDELALQSDSNNVQIHQDPAGLQDGQAVHVDLDTVETSRLGRRVLAIKDKTTDPTSTWTDSTTLPSSQCPVPVHTPFHTQIPRPSLQTWGICSQESEVHLV